MFCFAFTSPACFFTKKEPRTVKPGFFFPMTTEQFMQIDREGPKLFKEEKNPEEESLFSPKNIRESLLGDTWHKLPSGEKLFPIAVNETIRFFVLTPQKTVKNLKTVIVHPPEGWNEPHEKSQKLEKINELIRNYPGSWITKYNKQKLENIDQEEVTTPPRLWYEWKKQENKAFPNLLLYFTKPPPHLTIIRHTISTDKKTSVKKKKLYQKLFKENK